MKKFLLAPALAALAVFFWGYLYWGAPPLLPYKTLGTIDNVSENAIAIGKSFPASGTYLLPSPLQGMDKMQELSARGPRIEVHITKEGMTSADQAKGMVLGFVHMFVLAVLLTIILCTLAKAFVCAMCRVRFCAAIGLLVALSDLGNVIWWHHALPWTLTQAFYDFSSYTIIGLVVAKFITPKAVEPGI